MLKWRKASSCAPGAAAESCWCEPGKPGKFWERSERVEAVPHILKGGEDSIGVNEAIQRVYFNIGSCAEQCWVNHLTDLRQLDPQARNFGQTPFDIGQCRRDCPNFRAIEDRLTDIAAFLFSRETHATDLAVARHNELKAKGAKASYTQDNLVAELDRQFGRGAVARVREVFATTCARCHSSIPESQGGAFRNRAFRALDAKTGLRGDWLGNDQATLVGGVGTNRCRALHSNHMAGHQTSFPIEYILSGNFIIEDVDPDPEVVGEASVLDTLFEGEGIVLLTTPPPGGGTPRAPTMTYYHGSQANQFVFTGFGPWLAARQDCIALFDFVLQDLWGLPRAAVDRGSFGPAYQRSGGSQPARSASPKRTANASVSTGTTRE